MISLLPYLTALFPRTLGLGQGAADQSAPVAPTDAPPAGTWSSFWWGDYDADGLFDAFDVVVDSAPLGVSEIYLGWTWQGIDHGFEVIPRSSAGEPHPYTISAPRGATVLWWCEKDHRPAQSAHLFAGVEALGSRLDKVVVR